MLCLSCDEYPEQSIKWKWILGGKLKVQPDLKWFLEDTHPGWKSHDGPVELSNGQTPALLVSAQEGCQKKSYWGNRSRS